MLICLILSIPSHADDKPRHDAMAVQTAYIYHFIHFVRWPESTEVSIPAFTLCIDNEEGNHEHINALTQKRIRKRPILIKQITSQTSDFESCHLLFINNFSDIQQRTILEKIGNKPILTIGTSDSFLDMNGMIQFHVAHGEVTFSVNLKSVTQANLIISSNMLDVAQEVYQ